MTKFLLFGIVAVLGTASGLELLSFCALPLPISSGQFSTLCRLPDPDSAINYQFPEGANYVNTSFLSPLELSLLKTVENATANAVCDYDCRCIHGATPAGGRCGVRPGETVATNKYCICDYSTTPHSQCLIPKSLRTMCSNPVLTGPYLDHLCDVDCVCSHGYQSNPAKSYCGPLPSAGDIQVCLCNNGTNIPA